ncbi:WXG100 family type VII secretion target [Streptomyces sp. ISL-100]|nr:WXG100 family type VII secretion target [Streptomyces sp. ISL-100]
MSGKESVAEEIVEAGFEIVNPGGRPEELRQAAKAWRQLQSDVEGQLKALDRNVEDTVGDTWRGPAAEAFKKYWLEFKASVKKSTEQYDEVAKGLDEAADAIEQCNDENSCNLCRNRCLGRGGRSSLLCYIRLRWCSRCS